MTMKVDYTLLTNAMELLKRVNAKMEKIKPELAFDPNKKILKVHSLK
jgi:hypothetical protein